jgi:hypothetical protein
MGDKSPKSKTRNQQQKNAVKQDAAVKARSKQERQATPEQGKKQR